jgi:hypothetical protein
LQAQVTAKEISRFQVKEISLEEVFIGLSKKQEGMGVEGVGVERLWYQLQYSDIIINGKIHLFRQGIVLKKEGDMR